MARPHSQCVDLNHLGKKPIGKGLKQNISKQIFTLLFILLTGGCTLQQEELKTRGDCTWTSAEFPDAQIRIKPRTDTLPIREGELIYKGKVIYELGFVQAMGYGSTGWHFRNGEKGFKRRGGALIQFRDYKPWKGSKQRSFKGQSRQALLVDLGSDLYYGNYRDTPELWKAAEGFWILPKGCTFPGLDSRNDLKRLP